MPHNPWSILWEFHTLDKLVCQAFPWSEGGDDVFLGEGNGMESVGSNDSCAVVSDC